MWIGSKFAKTVGTFSLPHIYSHSSLLTPSYSNKSISLSHLMRHLLPSRILGKISSSPWQQQEAINPNLHLQNPRDLDKFNPDVVVILSALLCAIICVLGLFAAVRCTWLRHFSAGRPIHPPPPPPLPTPPPTSGLNENVFESLPKATFEPNIDGKLLDCAICLADFAKGDEVRVLPQCGHGFYVLCIDTWLGTHSSCPSCRQILVSAKCGCQNRRRGLVSSGAHEKRSFR